MRRGPRNLRIAFDAEALTHYGGAILVHQFLHRLGLRTHLSWSVRFAQRNNRYYISETLLALLYPVILGIERLEMTEPLQQNGVFQYLTGLPGYPTPTSLRRFLQRFGQAGRSGFLKLHDRYRQAMLAALRRQVVLDLVFAATLEFLSPTLSDVFLRAFEAGTGRLLWVRQSFGGDLAVSASAVYTTSSHLATPPSGGLHAIDAGTGATRWTVPGGQIGDLKLTRSVLFAKCSTDSICAVRIDTGVVLPGFGGGYYDWVSPTSNFVVGGGRLFLGKLGGYGLMAIGP